MDETSIPASDVLSLIQTHLVESGLHSTSRALALESGGLARCPGLAPPAKSSLVRAASRGSWGEVLSVLHDLDVERARRGGGGGLDDDGDILRRRLRLRETGDNGDVGDDGGGGGGGRPSSTSASPAVAAPLERAVAMAHEMAVLELADLGEYELAYATLRSCSGMLDRTLPTPTSGGGDGDDGGEEEDDRDNIGNGDYSRSGDVERRIASLVSTRRSPRGDGGDGDDGAPLHPPPLDYYGGSSSSTANNSSKQGRRDFIAKALRRHVPELPTRRLVSLLQQSVKWQCHTGTYPTVARLFRRRSATAEEDNGVGGGDDVNNDEDDNDLDGGMGDRKKKEKGKKKKRKRDDGDDDGVERKFDLVLGNVIVDATGHGKDKRGRGSGPTSAVGYNASAAAERLPSRPHQTVRLGKRSYVECATFLPDGTGLVTGSSDGFVEVWGERRSTRTTVVVDGDGAAGDPKTTTAIAIAGGADDVDFEALRTSDLPYQRDDDLMMHDSPVLALDVSNDGTLLGTSSSNGTVCVWKISDGKMLRKMERAHGGIVGLGGVDRGEFVLGLGERIALVGVRELTTTQEELVRTGAWNFFVFSPHSHARTHALTHTTNRSSGDLHPILARRVQGINGGSRLDVPRVRTARVSNAEGIPRTQVVRELLRLRRPPSLRIGGRR